MVRLKSFLSELESFYLRAWQQAKRAGYAYNEIAASILRAAREGGDLTLDYAKQLLAGSGPFVIDLMRDDYTLKRDLPSIGARVEVKGLREMALDVIGLLDVPSGRGLWLYAYSPEYERFFVLRVRPKNPMKFAKQVLFKRVLLSARKGSLMFIFALNKAYRHKLKLRFRIAGAAERLPRLKPEQVLLFRRGLVMPSLLVEAPAPSERGGLTPGIGFIAIVSGARVRQRAGNKVDLEVEELALMLDSSYAPLGGEGGSHVLLLFLRRRGIDGYYLGSTACEKGEADFAFYLPKNLFTMAKGAEVTRMITVMPNSLLRFYEPLSEGSAAEYEALRRRLGSTRREALQEFYSRKADEVFTIPNPALASYEELPIWLMAAGHLRKRASP